MTQSLTSAETRIVREFKAGLSFVGLARKYGVTVAKIESIIRKYSNRLRRDIKELEKVQQVTCVCGQPINWEYYDLCRDCWLEHYIQRTYDDCEKTQRKGGFDDLIDCFVLRLEYSGLVD